MKKAVKVFLVVLSVIAVMVAFSSCGKKKDIIGQWYNSNGEVEYDFREDGTYDDDGYGTGTWKYLDDGETIEFTDFYGYTKTTKISEDDFGLSIFEGRFYKDKYPAEEMSQYKEATAEMLNAFEGISYEVSGISPFCKVQINNQNCSDAVKQYVTFSLNKEYYANGEVAVISAVLSSNTGDITYKLESTESTYEVSGQAEYLNSFDDLNKDFMKKEVEDNVTALISSAIGTDRLCDIRSLNILNREKGGAIYHNKITEVNPEHKATYLSCLKEQKKELAIVYQPFNRCSYIYCFDTRGIIDDVTYEGKLYVNITAENIVCLPDGSVYWNNEKCDFEIETSTDGFDNLVSNTVMCNSDNYNITKVENGGENNE